MRSLLTVGFGVLIQACGGGAFAGYEARGTVEVPEIDLAAPAPARVVALRVEEGARVEAGDTLALLTQADLPAALAAHRARLAAAEANLRDLEAGPRPQEIGQAQAALGGAEAEALRTRQALERARTLIETNAIARQQYDDAVAASRVAEQRVMEAREAVGLARAGYRPERIEAARAEARSAREALRQVEARAGELVLVAPVGGIVLGRHAEPGEALGPNVPVLSVGETGRPHVRVFVPQTVVAALALGTEADIVTEDARTFRGRVAAVNPRAEFTPRVALTEEERSDLMFAVKVEFVEPAEAPHPGLWVVVRLAGRQSGGAAEKGRG
jgi:HlyD family secretion protein